MKTILIIIGLLILSGSAYAALRVGDVATDLATLDFKASELSIVTTATKWATTTDETGAEIRTGLRIPVTYNYPIATSTGFVVEEVKEDIGMNVDSYSLCRSLGKTKTVCVGELNDDIEQNIETFKINKERELDELKRKDFKDELSF